MSKLMMLVAAKWREFSNINPHLQAEQSEPTETEYNLKPSRTRPAKESKVIENFAYDLQKLYDFYFVLQDTDVLEDDDDEDEDDDSKNKKRRGSRIKKSSKKTSKVPTLKIKIGKRKRGSSVIIFI